MSEQPTLYLHYNQDKAPEGWTVATRALSPDDSITYVVPVERNYKAAGKAVEEAARKFIQSPPPSGQIGWGLSPLELATIAIDAAYEVEPA